MPKGVVCTTPLAFRLGRQRLADFVGRQSFTVPGSLEAGLHRTNWDIEVLAGDDDAVEGRAIAGLRDSGHPVGSRVDGHAVSNQTSSIIGLRIEGQITNDRSDGHVETAGRRERRRAGRWSPFATTVDLVGNFRLWLLTAAL